MGVRRGELDGAAGGDHIVLKLLVGELGAVVSAVQLGGTDVLGVGFPLAPGCNGVTLGMGVKNVAAAGGFIDETYRETAAMNVWGCKRTLCVTVDAVAEDAGGMYWRL